MDLRIVIGQRGWVWVGRYESTLDEVTLRDARCIHRWGTKNGLGEIAAKGPTPQTVLQDPGTIHLHRLAVVASMDCDAKAWSKVFAKEKA